MGETIGIKTFAEKFGVKQSTVARWCREGRLEATQDSPGSPWHISVDAPPLKTVEKRGKIGNE